MKEMTDNDQSLYLASNRLKALQTASLVIRQITKILLLLLHKRATVAEKAIQAELSHCASLESSLIASLTQSFVDQDDLFTEKDCQKLRQINIRLNKQLRAFLKAAAYNLNYLEQYCEHPFWLALSEYKFTKQLSDLAEKSSLRKY